MTSKLFVWGLVAAIMVLGTVNNVLYKVLYSYYGNNFAFFLDQGNNALYPLLAMPIVAWRVWKTRQITKEMRQFPQSKFVVMAIADALGTFLTAMGAVYTPGQYQTVLSQALIPTTMVTSFVMLGTRYTGGEVLGAAVVLAGAVVTAGDTFFGSNSAVGEARWYACVIYFLSNIPMAFSATYKEWGFKEHDLDCFYLTYCVAWYQLFLSFPMAPLQSIPGVVDADGIPPADIWRDLWYGTECFFGHNSHPDIGGEGNCEWGAVLLVSYTIVNFVYNVMGLLLTVHASAVLRSIAYALKLPLTNLVFCWPALMGKYTEKFTLYSVAGLVCVFSGFVVYLYSAEKATHKNKEVLLTEPETEPELRQTWAFHERVVGVMSSGTVRASRPRAVSLTKPLFDDQDENIARSV